MNTINQKTTLQFPEEFFNEEVRCDFVVTKKRKKIWAIEIDLLNELLKICKKYNIKVIVYGGTLLGAIRHKGMIPWDDDIDVALTRPEYEKLCKVATDELKYPYFFQTALTDRKFFCGYARLRNSLTTGLIKGMESPQYNNGIYIDIFVLDGYIEDENLANEQSKKRIYVSKLANAYNMTCRSRNPIKKIALFFLSSIMSFTYNRFVSYRQIVEKYNKILNQYTDKTDRLSLMTHHKNIYSKYWCKKKDLEDIIYIDFENIKVPIPHNYDSILSNTYGNYMDFPPVEKRGTWHNIIQFDPDVPYVDYIKQKKHK